MNTRSRKNEIIDAKEACAILGGISVMTLRRRVAAGLLAPLPKPPGLIRRHVLQFYRADVEKLLEG